ncbi:hypothetical protein FA10DRAFT_270036 [Acaromyces ingoldii]|uniref:Uncharacterized protein n=1 Tax=Acaromyces ingoldii TaxID=215250 RepID=A0A316YCS6_9BASI|nr:hypothetical protein FA10DRAFT_270036 [Acaromyces ingoldii]PWN86664.1 hypothetical protein FA10DRAFT_270036 [Acaromyces ingoldii]
MRWKPAQSLSVDLLVQRSDEAGFSRLMGWKGRDEFIDCGKISSEVVELPASKSCDVGEFVFLPCHAQWLFIRWRHDRFRPNHIDRIQQLIELSKDCVEYQEILAVSRACRARHGAN